MTSSFMSCQTENVRIMRSACVCFAAFTRIHMYNAPEEDWERKKITAFAQNSCAYTRTHTPNFVYHIKHYNTDVTQKLYHSAKVRARKKQRAKQPGWIFNKKTNKLRFRMQPNKFGKKTRKRKKLYKNHGKYSKKKMKTVHLCAHNV